jgi:membrane protein required for colicin V production
LNPLDVIILLAIGAFAIYGIFKGLIRLLIGFFSFSLGILLAAWLGAPFAATFEGLIGSPTLRLITAWVILFIAALAGCGILGRLIRRALKPADLLWADRLAGAVAGMALAVLMVASAMLPITAIVPAESSLLRESRLAPHVLALSSFLKALVPEELRHRYEVARERLRDGSEEAIPAAGEIRKGIETLKERRSAEKDDEGG